MAIAAFKPRQAEFARGLVAASGLPIEVHVGRTPELISTADCCMAVSGSVSLELLYHAKPTVVLYRISRAAYFVQGLFRRVKYITLVNLLNAGEIYPPKRALFNREQSDAERGPVPRISDLARQIVTDRRARDRVAYRSGRPAGAGRRFTASPRSSRWEGPQPARPRTCSMRSSAGRLWPRPRIFLPKAPAVALAATGRLCFSITAR